MFFETFNLYVSSKSFLILIYDKLIINTTTNKFTITIKICLNIYYLLLLINLFIINSIMKTEKNTLKDRIINYESTIFEDYVSRRNEFINNIKNMDINSLSNEQLNNFMHDIKMIIEPIKSSSENIDYYFTNNLVNFEKNNSITELKDFENIITLYQTINLLSLQQTPTPTQTPTLLS